MRGESWKFRCQQCLARSGKERTRELVETEYACIVEADGSARKRLEGTLHKDHEDHIAGKGINSLNHYNLVYKFIPMPQAMKIQAAKEAVDKEWKKKLGGNIGMAPDKSQKQERGEVIDEARHEGKTMHFASEMDICHLKNSELEPKFQKYRSRFVLRGVFVKDDSGSYAVFTEQGSSASQMTAAKVMDVMARLGLFPEERFAFSLNCLMF